MIFHESQLARDVELASLMGRPLEYIESLEIGTPESLRIYNGNGEMETEQDFLKLYRRYKHLDIIQYIKTLMLYSITRRHRELKDLVMSTKNKKCLDFGSGVGTHAIAMLQMENDVSILDIDGELLHFAIKRILNRDYQCGCYTCKMELPEDYFDFVICTDVLEHVYDPMIEINKITNAIKVGGILHLQVSKMIKPSSGHFKSTIEKWQKYGIKYMDKHYSKEGETIYRRNNEKRN